MEQLLWTFDDVVRFVDHPDLPVQQAQSLLFLPNGRVRGGERGRGRENARNSQVRAANAGGVEEKQ
jgi:hypothetical protein